MSWRSSEVLVREDGEQEKLVVLDATTLAPVGGDPVLVGALRPHALCHARRPHGGRGRVEHPDQGETKVLLVDLETRRIVRSTPVEALDRAEEPARNNTVAPDGRTVGVGGRFRRRRRRRRGDRRRGPAPGCARRFRGERHVRTRPRDLRDDGAGRRSEAVGHGDAATSSAPSSLGAEPSRPGVVPRRRRGCSSSTTRARSSSGIRDPTLGRRTRAGSPAAISPGPSGPTCSPASGYRRTCPQYPAGI